MFGGSYHHSLNDLAINLIQEVKGFPPELKQLINNAKWTYAKTMPEWEHYYIVRDKVDEVLFVRVVEHIRYYGYQGAFYNKTYIYFEEDGLIYWTMGNPVDVTTIINRTRKENSYEERLKNGTLPKEKPSNA